MDELYFKYRSVVHWEREISHFNMVYTYQFCVYLIVSLCFPCFFLAMSGCTQDEYRPWFFCVMITETSKLEASHVDLVSEFVCIPRKVFVCQPIAPVDSYKVPDHSGVPPVSFQFICEGPGVKSIKQYTFGDGFEN